MDDITIITLVTVLYGINTIALVVVTAKIHRMEIVIAKLCVRMGCENDN
jgi:hypothetical protein